MHAETYHQDYLIYHDQFIEQKDQSATYIDMQSA